jgi:hypothetical protein
MNDALPDAIGADLSELVRDTGKQLKSCDVITTIRTRRNGGETYLIEFEDGSRVKGRCLASEEQARRIERIRAGIGPGFCGLIARRRSAVIEEWIDGVPLETCRPFEPSILNRCGEILGALHSLDPAQFGYVQPACLETYLERLDERERHITKSGLLEPGESARVRDLARGYSPSALTSGIIHQDFCAENIILRDSLVPVCVDNTRLDHGPVLLDLARTWYRWPMSESEESRFLDGYRTISPSVVFKGFGFWALYVLVEATSWRFRVAPDLVEVPRQRLKSLLARLARHGDTTRERV